MRKKPTPPADADYEFVSRETFLPGRLDWALKGKGRIDGKYAGIVFTEPTPYRFTNFEDEADAAAFVRQAIERDITNTRTFDIQLPRTVDDNMLTLVHTFAADAARLLRYEMRKSLPVFLVFEAGKHVTALAFDDETALRGDTSRFLPCIEWVCDRWIDPDGDATVPKWRKAR